MIEPSGLCTTQIDGVPPLRPMISLAAAFFPFIEEVCCPRTCSALTRVPFATHATCQPVVWSVRFETVTFPPGLRTVAFGGARALLSAVDVVALWLACVVDERVGAPVDPVSPQPEAARTPVTMSSIHTGHHRDRTRPGCDDRGEPVRMPAITGG
jgi:hypothetical protein